MKRFSFRKVAGFIIIAFVGVLVVSTIVRLLWNALMPDLFHLPLISFWQALGLLLLAKILFGGFRGPSSRGPWKEKMRQRWMNMTPEERDRFKQDWGKRCRWPDTPFSDRKGFPESSERPPFTQPPTAPDNASSPERP
jgi:hypothetical protein